MKYLFISQGDGTVYIPNLLQEINRFDVRAEFSCYLKKRSKQQLPFEEVTILSKKQFGQNLGKEDLDVVVVIGGGLSLRQCKILKHKTTALIYFQLPEVDLSGRRAEKLAKMYDHLLLTLPHDNKDNSKINYVGCPIADDIRRHSFDLISDSETAGIGILCKKTSNSKLTKFLEARFPDVNLFFLDAGSAAQSLEVLKNVNVAITFNKIDELKALLVNCPQIRYAPRTLFGTKKKSIVNQIGRQSIVKELSGPQEIETELKKMLHDHQYCAAMMQEYQVAKDTIGHEPAYRKAAQKIIEIAELKDN